MQTIFGSGITADRLRSTSFETQFISCRGRCEADRVTAVQVTEQGLRLCLHSKPDRLIETFKQWHLHKRSALIDDLSLRFSPANTDLFRQQFNLLRMRRDPASTFIQCPCCQLLHPIQPGSVQFCDECLGMHVESQPLTTKDGYQFNFCQDGLFSLLGPTGSRATRPSLINGQTAFRSLRTAVRPLIDRITSHLLWLTLFALLFQFYPRVATPLIFLSLFLVGCYTTLLLLRGAIKCYFFPPSWEVLAQKVRQGKVADAEQWVVDEALSDQPGLAANLAIGHIRAGNKIKASEWLDRARSACPSHPALEQLAAQLDG